MITAPATLATAAGLGSGPIGVLVAVGWALGVTAIRIASKTKSIDIDDIETPSPETSTDEAEDDNRADLSPVTGSRLALDPFHGRKGEIVIIQPPASEICTPKPSALALSLAYSLDIYLELKDPNWQGAIWKSGNPRKSLRFLGNKLNTAQLMRDLAPHIPETVNAASNSTVRKRIDDAEYLITSGWQSPQRHSGRQQSAAYRTLYGLCQLVIITSGDDSITRGISSPARKAATLFQGVVQLPDDLTEEQLVQCLEKCWKQ
jgi:hypothetical protein